jgi:hypothetical protein
METTEDLKHWLEKKIVEFADPSDDYEEGLRDAYEMALHQVNHVLTS